MIGPATWGMKMDSWVHFFYVEVTGIYMGRNHVIFVTEKFYHVGVLAKRRRKGFISLFENIIYGRCCSGNFWWNDIVYLYVFRFVHR